MSKIWRSLAVITMAIMTSGCTVIGFGTGSILDLSKSGYKKTDYWSRVVQKPGTRAKLTVIDSSAGRAGTIVCLDTITEREYGGVWQVYRELDPLQEWIPTPGDTVTFGAPGTLPMTGIFLGYDYSPARIRNAIRKRLDATQFGCGYLLRVDTLDTFLAFEKVTSVSTGDGRNCLLQNLVRLARDRRLPWRTQLKLSVNGTIHSVDINKIAECEAKVGKNNKWVLGGIGLAVDMILVIGIITSPDPWGY